MQQDHTPPPPPPPPAPIPAPPSTSGVSTAETTQAKVQRQFGGASPIVIPDAVKAARGIQQDISIEPGATFDPDTRAASGNRASALAQARDREAGQRAEKRKKDSSSARDVGSTLMPVSKSETLLDINDTTTSFDVARLEVRHAIQKDGRSYWERHFGGYPLDYIEKCLAVATAPPTATTIRVELAVAGQVVPISLTDISVPALEHMYTRATGKRGTPMAKDIRQWVILQVVQAAKE
jgi:hypothetical protein